MKNYQTCSFGFCLTKFEFNSYFLAFIICGFILAYPSIDLELLKLMYMNISGFFKKKAGAIIALSLMLGGCDALYDDSGSCETYLKFKYDYNMLYADAFSNQVDKVEVFFFDKDGKYVRSITEEGEALKSSGYKMKLPTDLLGANAVTWAGHHDSYTLEPLIEGESTTSDLLLKMKRNDSSRHNERLEPLWHGASLSISPKVGEVQEIGLVRNTNNIRIILKNVDDADTPVAADNIEFKVTANNGFYNFDNSLHKDNVITYLPHYLSGDTRDGVIAEISTLRLLEDKNVRLSIYNKADNTYLFGGAESINLIKYFLMTKMEEYKMTSQEYLDRQYDWNLTFFYTSGSFVAVQIVINGWTVWTAGVDM